MYNEEVNDLLEPANKKLPVHESREAGVYVAGLREDIVTSPEAVRVVSRVRSWQNCPASPYSAFRQSLQSSCRRDWSSQESRHRGICTSSRCWRCWRKARRTDILARPR